MPCARQQVLNVCLLQHGGNASWVALDTQPPLGDSAFGLRWIGGGDFWIARDRADLGVVSDDSAIGIALWLVADLDATSPTRTDKPILSDPRRRCSGGSVNSSDNLNG